MKAVITDEEVHVYNSMEENTLSIATFHKGDVVELGKVTRKKNQTWVEVDLKGEQKGYIPGETKIFSIKKAQLMSNSVDLHESPDEASPVLKTYTKGATMTVSGVENLDAGNWFKIEEEPDVVGYIPAKTSKLRVVVEPSRSGAIRNFIIGAVFAAIGLALTLANSSANQQSGMIYISYAVIFFGLLQMGQGVFEYVKFRNKDKTKS